MGKEHKHCLRDGTFEMFNDLNALKVPILVFSAGIGDTVSSILQQAGVMMPTVKVFDVDFFVVFAIRNGFRLCRIFYDGKMVWLMDSVRKI